MRTVKSFVWIAVIFLPACATYRPLPLPTAPDLARAPVLTMSPDKMKLPGLKPHPFNPAQGLDETTVMTLAVLNNPDLKAARLKAGVAGAQLLEAGLLPDPRLSGSVARSTVHSGYAVGLSEDIQAMITRGAAKAAARAHARQVSLEILWQEWQVAEKARGLFIQARADDQLQPLLTETRDLFADIYRQDQAAVRRYDVAADTLSADFKALADADAALRQLQLRIDRTRHEFNRLLGLKPDVQLRLAAGERRQPLSRRQFEAAVAAIPLRRADLLALQAGYESQEQRLREAVLAQFPALSAGVEQGRSAEEGIHTTGFTVTLTLPLFNRNRGQIAIQRATRALLRQTYQARLDEAASEADQLWEATRIMTHQLQDLDAKLPALETNVAAADASYRRGDLDSASYVGLKSNFLAKQAEAIRLQRSLAQAQSALEILLGLPLAL